MGQILNFVAIHGLVTGLSIVGGVPPPAKILENPPPLKKEKNNREDNTYCLRTIGTILRTIDAIFFSDLSYFIPKLWLDEI